MTAQATNIRESFLMLSKSEQLELMHYFLKVVATSDFTLTEEWKRELDNRDEDYKNGISKAIPLKEALTQFDI